MTADTRNKSKFGRSTTGALLKDKRGSTIIMVCVALVLVFAFAVLAIDGAIVMASKTQLQAAADAAALAGASGLLTGSQDEAVARAIDLAGSNEAVEETRTPVVITVDDVTFPQSDVCRVRTHRTVDTGDPVRTYFVRVLVPGSKTADMTAVAAAQAFDVCGSKCIKPWAIPDQWVDGDSDGVCDPGEYDPDVTGYQAPRDVGERVVLKVGLPQDTDASGIFYPVDFPPIDKFPNVKPFTGSDNYREWIAGCSPWLIEPGDSLQLEPGRMVGPTRQGMDDLIAQDPGAYWDTSTKSVANSAFALSPRIGLVPFFDPTLPPTSGRKNVKVVKLGAFFIESMDGQNVTGRFMQITTAGVPCGNGLGNSLVKGIALIE
jgi:Flp pilus assembly protein TadG